jgi:tripartite-type tricarboxylate transporter receptor subunit TctC
MTDTSASGGDLDQFIVAARDASANQDLAAFEAALKDLPTAAIISRGGRPDQPHLVVTMTSKDVDQLKSRFGSSLIIERNAKLNPL